MPQNRSAEPLQVDYVPASGALSLHQWRLWLSGIVGSRYDGLRHFAVVDPGVLLRCGQPRVRDLDKIREQHGLRAIVCVRGGVRHPIRGRWFRKERAYCERHGIQLLHMRMSDKASPANDIFQRFLGLTEDPGNHPVLVHCEQGFHRTGVLCAVHRVARNGWPLSLAVEEMVRLGFEMSKAKRRPLVEALTAWTREHYPDQADCTP